MNQYTISQYLAEVEDIIHFGGTKNETALRSAFYCLLNEFAKTNGLMIVTEISIKGTKGKNVIPDGTLKDSLRQDWGYWESKDEVDNIDEEIIKKFDKGYPKDNILFEDSQTAILIQNGFETMRVSMKDAPSLNRILNAFIKFERQEVQNFRKAIDLFKQDVPSVTKNLRTLIIEQEKTNKKFNEAAKGFLKICQESINPDVVIEDIREMIIQHILTEDIFNTIFGETQFHRENNIAHQLELVIDTFFFGIIRRTALSNVKYYYEAISAAAATIADHHEKQKFLKIIYETFYKSYNPQAADRLGVVYTPNEIVRFMVKSTDYLLHKHFGKFLEDKNVEILDPATGTGTFICDIIDYIRKDKLEYKYANELHANEVAILPYYISNLNIEYTYKQKAGKYKEYANLCFADTLDNILGLDERITALENGKYKTTGDLFAMSTENKERITKQNARRISVVIGNPPYNANQMSENDNNKNREYPFIDRRIKDTFIAYSTAQKTKVYDMYARFYRWAMDRLNGNGMISFVTNRSFIDSRTFDGFRKCIQEEFDFAYIIDTKSDVRANPKISGTAHNVFGIQTGVAIMFLVRKDGKEKKNCTIWYTGLDDFWKKAEKLQWLSMQDFRTIPFDHVIPDKHYNWINIAENDFESLMPICSKDVKNGKSVEALFEIYSLGIATNRDEWVYDYNKINLKNKIKYFAEGFNSESKRWKNSEQDIKIKNFVARKIKWTDELLLLLNKKVKLKYDDKYIRKVAFRPFLVKNCFYKDAFIHRFYQHKNIFPIDSEWKNRAISFTCISSDSLLSTLACAKVMDLGYLKTGNGGTFCISFYRVDEAGNYLDNITNWGITQFINYYKSNKITKEDLFNYVYAVLHNPTYRTKYALNLKREFPRIPYYKDFFKWANWGKQLMDLHTDYDNTVPYQLKEILVNNIEFPKAKLKADKDAGTIVIDENTLLKGVPEMAWNYKLGNRSAIEWVLDQYKENKPKDTTIAEQFDAYRFADYKTIVIDLLKKVCTVSVDTMKIMHEMELEN